MVRKTFLTKQRLINDTRLEEKPEYNKLLADKPNVKFKIPNRKSLEYLRGHFNIVYLDDNRVRKMQQDFLLERFSKYYGFKVGEVKAALESNNMEVIPEVDASEFASAFGSMAASPIVEASGGDNPPPPPPGGAGLLRQMFTRLISDRDMANTLSSFFGRQPPPSPDAGGEQIPLFSPQRPPLNMVFGQRPSLLFGESPQRTLIGTTPLGSPATEQQILASRQQELNSALERAFYEEQRRQILQHTRRSEGRMPDISEFVQQRPQIFDMSAGDDMSPTSMRNLPPVSSTPGPSTPARTETQFTTDETGQAISQEVEAPTYLQITEKEQQEINNIYANIPMIYSDAYTKTNITTEEDKYEYVFMYIDNLLKTLNSEFKTILQNKRTNELSKVHEDYINSRLQKQVDDLYTALNKFMKSPQKVFSSKEYTSFNQEMKTMMTADKYKYLITKFTDPSKILNLLEFIEYIEPEPFLKQFRQPTTAKILTKSQTTEGIAGDPTVPSARKKSGSSGALSKGVGYSSGKP